MRCTLRGDVAWGWVFAGLVVVNEVLLLAWHQERLRRMHGRNHGLGCDEGFIVAFERAGDFLQAQEGYRSTELHQSLGSDAEFRFVNVAEWASPGAFQAAVGQPGFREAAAAIQHRAHPSLYQVVRH